MSFWIQWVSAGLVELGGKQLKTENRLKLLDVILIPSNSHLSNNCFELQKNANDFCQTVCLADILV